MRFGVGLMSKLETLPKPTLLTAEELKEILKTNEQLNCGSRGVNDKNCSNCIHYHCEPMQGGSVDVCTAKKGEFYGSYVIKNINNICPKYETPFMRKNKQEKVTNNVKN